MFSPRNKLLRSKICPSVSCTVNQPSKNNNSMEEIQNTLDIDFYINYGATKNNRN